MTNNFSIIQHLYFRVVFRINYNIYNKIVLLFSGIIFATQAFPGSSQSFDQVAFGSNPELKKHFHFYNLMDLFLILHLRRVSG